MRNISTFPTRLVVISLVVLLLVGASGMATLLWFSETSAVRDGQTVDALENVVLAERLRADVERTLASSRGFLLTADPSALERARAAQSDANHDRHDMRLRTQTPDGARSLAQLGFAFDRYNEALEGLLEAKTKGMAVDVISLQFERELLPRRKALDDAVNAFMAHRNDRFDTVLSANRRGDQQGLKFGLMVVMASVVSAGSLAWWAARQLRASYERTEASEQTARRAVSSREQLLATVAHDLRSPLSAIAIRAALISKGTDLERSREQAASIAGVATRMDHLIGSLLDAARLDAGSFRVRKVRCDLRPIVQEAVDVFISLATTKSISLVSTVASEALVVLVEKERILQVLSNLIANALKFTPEGGTVQVTAAQLGEVVQISVCDTGPGIAPEHVQHLFDRFWQADGGAGRGTGLGLFIAKGIVDAHAGRIWVESELGRGASFHFTLPCADRVVGAVDVTRSKTVPSPPEGGS
jgi:signal transduction histidine kinase